MSHSTANSFSSMPMTCPFTGAGGVGVGGSPTGRDSSGITLTSLYEEEKLECPFGGGGNDASSLGPDKQDQSSTRSLTVTSDEGKILMGKLIKRNNSIENLKKLAESMNGGGGGGSDSMLDCVVSVSPTTPTPKGNNKAISSKKLMKKAKNAEIVAKISMEYTNGLPSSMVCSIFPYHVVSTLISDVCGDVT
jgi:hypothetical protein